MLIVTAVGNLGSDPEAFQAGTTPGAKFSFAARTNKDETSWINCKVFGARSSAALDYLKKGSHITVSGKGSIRNFERKDGSKGSSFELNVSEFTLPKRESQEQASNVTPFPAQKSFNNNDIY